MTNKITQDPHIRKSNSGCDNKCLWAVWFSCVILFMWLAAPETTSHRKNAETKKLFIVVVQSLNYVSFRSHGPQHTRLPCPSPYPRACSNSCPSSQWCHPTISSSVIPFSFCLQSFPESGSFPVSQLFVSGGQRTGASASASVLPVNIQGWLPLDWLVWSPCCPGDSQEIFSYF